MSTSSDGRGELWAGSYISDTALKVLEGHATTFVEAAKAAMDAAVVATAQTVCSTLWPVDPATHRMPLEPTGEAFDALVAQGHLLGLRPDQVRTLRELQPFVTGTRAADFVGAHTTHLAAALDAISRGDRLTVGWATHTGPELHAHEEGRYPQPAQSRTGHWSNRDCCAT